MHTHEQQLSEVQTYLESQRENTLEKSLQDYYDKGIRTFVVGEAHGENFDEKTALEVMKAFEDKTGQLAIEYDLAAQGDIELYLNGKIEFETLHKNHPRAFGKHAKEIFEICKEHAITIVAIDGREPDTHVRDEKMKLRMNDIARDNQRPILITWVGALHAKRLNEADEIAYPTGQTAVICGANRTSLPSPEMYTDLHVLSRLPESPLAEEPMSTFIPGFHFKNQDILLLRGPLYST